MSERLSINTTLIACVVKWHYEAAVMESVKLTKSAFLADVTALGCYWSCELETVFIVYIPSVLTRLLQLAALRWALTRWSWVQQSASMVNLVRRCVDTFNHC